MRALIVISALALGCAGEAADQPTSRFAIQAEALTYQQVGGASYALTVRHAGPAPDNVVWQRAGLTSERFGDGRGAISYVGPCDAGKNPHAIELVLEWLADGSGDPLEDGTWVNPAPAGSPVVLAAHCSENADTPVTFNLTVMRDAAQGFFDVAVSFEDIFCSAKVDCTDTLLHDGAERGPTVVLAFACTSGGAAGSPEATWLHLSDVVLTCAGQPALYFDPAGATGKNGALGATPTFFDTAIYRGQEDLPGVDKCYWNSALGIRLGAGAIDCRLSAQGTASHASFGAAGLSPANSVYPYIDFDVTLSDAAGRLVCGDNALDAPGSGVVTAYTPPTGAAFVHEWECDPATAPLAQSMRCDGGLAGDPAVAVLPSPGGVSVTLGGVRSPPYTLPAGAFVGGDAACCVNPCCDVSAGP